MRVFTKDMEGHSVLTYSYNASRDMGFQFHLLGEVGEPWQEQARKKALALAKERKCVIDTVELTKRPWLVDVLVKAEQVTEPATT